MENNQLIRLQETEIEILREFKRICEKNNLRYYLFYGTLLGAVRHNGFIPWDDDVDVAMPREDYEKFLQLAESELSEEFYLESCMKNENCALMFSKIRKKNTIFIINKGSYSAVDEKDKPLGIFIDIFPLDYTSNKINVFKKLKAKSCGLLTSYLYCRINKMKMSLKVRLLNLVLCFFSAKKIKNFRNRLMKGKGDTYFSLAGAYDVRRKLFSCDLFEPAQKMPFGDSSYSVPKDYDGVLKVTYGNDYMELPPVEKRVTHNPYKISFDVKSDYTEVNDESVNT